MSNQNKRIHEEVCIQAALKQIDMLKGYHIDTTRADNGLDEERPDFLLIKNGHRIGVEHFLVDTLLERSSKEDDAKSHSLSRRIPDEIMKIYTQYAGENINGKEIDALHAIEKEINLNFDRQSNFSYLSFISEFYRITCNHAHNVSHYKSENKIDTIGFICEIDVFDDTFMWNVMRNGNPCKQRIIPIPMTNCIWSLIHELLSCSIIDFFVIEVVPALYQEVVSKNIKSACYTKGHQPHVLFDSFAYYHQNISCTLRLEVDKNENNPT